jgi:hypothetical protein
MRRSFTLMIAGGAVVALATPCATTPTDATEGTHEELKQTVHAQISSDACRGVGLPDKFCNHLKSAVQAVDTEEWDSNTAHAVPMTGEDHCGAARSVSRRLRSIGSEIRIQLENGASDPDAIAKNLGRVLHTIQDNCSHEGMSNPQHAWGTLGDECSLGPPGRGDPDQIPAASACATSETREVMASFVRAMRGAGVSADQLSDSSGWYWVNYPPVAGVCSWLEEYSTWDGEDSRWNNRTTVPAFRRTLTSALEGGSDPGSDPCGFGGAAALDRGRIAEEIADARDEDADAVLGVGGLGARAAGGAEDLLGREPFTGPAEELDDERLEGAAPFEGDLAPLDAELMGDRVDDQRRADGRRVHLRGADTGHALRGRDVD